MIKITTKMLVALCAIGLLMGLAIGQLGTVIWSPSSGPTTATTPVVYPVSLSAVNWADTTHPSATPNPVNIYTGDSLTLSTTITPTTTHIQTVTFYYTNVVHPTLSTPIGTDPLTQLVFAGNGTGTSTASCNWVVPADGTYYFIAKLTST